ncbi:MAG: transcription elongation factor subunit Spt4 [Candidatus Aenigmatarchaeota archaeon]
MDRGGEEEAEEGKGIKMVKKIQVCRNCRRFTTETFCNVCKSTNLSTSWKGVVVILNTESEIAKTLKVEEPGRYALYVG